MIGFFPHDLSLYEQALSHKSTSLRTEDGVPINNERLEFLGDAILDAVVGHIVYEYFQRRGEGFLTNMRSKIVQRETLNKLAVEIGLDKMIKSTTHLSSHNSYMCGNAFEALVGAIYLDRGYENCKSFIETEIIGKYINLNKLSHKEVNFKSRLIEWGQKRKVKVVFHLICEQKDESRNPIFNTEVLLENIPSGQGEGYSKKESQQIAARAALVKLHDHDFLELIDKQREQREQTEEKENAETLPEELHEELVDNEEEDDKL
jgi:ribonuclease-3